MSVNTRGMGTMPQFIIRISIQPLSFPRQRRAGDVLRMCPPLPLPPPLAFRRGDGLRHPHCGVQHQQRTGGQHHCAGDAGRAGGCQDGGWSRLTKTEWMGTGRQSNWRSRRPEGAHQLSDRGLPITPPQETKHTHHTSHISDITHHTRGTGIFPSCCVAPPPQHWALHRCHRQLLPPPSSLPGCGASPPSPPLPPPRPPYLAALGALNLLSSISVAPTPLTLPYPPSLSACLPVTWFPRRSQTPPSTCWPPGEG